MMLCRYLKTKPITAISSNNYNDYNLTSDENKAFIFETDELCVVFPKHLCGMCIK